MAVNVAVPRSARWPPEAVASSPRSLKTILFSEPRKLNVSAAQASGTEWETSRLPGQPHAARVAAKCLASIYVPRRPCAARRRPRLRQDRAATPRRSCRERPRACPAQPAAVGEVLHPTRGTVCRIPRPANETRSPEVARDIPERSVPALVLLMLLLSGSKIRIPRSQGRKDVVARPQPARAF